ncbi:hypothetical protein GWN63_04530 [Candidatus Bathyarchaeota archaeon]|nr:hypothetical protein [Candidatus Bathyarchaeota archaeon]
MRKEKKKALMIVAVVGCCWIGFTGYILISEFTAEPVSVTYTVQEVTKASGTAHEKVTFTGGIHSVRFHQQLISDLNVIEVLNLTIDTEDLASSRVIFIDETLSNETSSTGNLSIYSITGVIHGLEPGAYSIEVTLWNYYIYANLLVSLDHRKFCEDRLVIVF